MSAAETQTLPEPIRPDHLINQSKDDLLKRFGKPLAKDRFTLAGVQADAAAADESKAPNPLRERMLAHLGEAIPDTYTEVTEFHWKGAEGAGDEIYTTVWFLKIKTVWTSFDALTWHQDQEWEQA